MSCRIRSAAERRLRTEALAAAVSDNGGVYLVPAFAGLSAPHWRPNARAALIDMTASTTKEHVVRAALESIAYQIRDAIEMLRADQAGALVADMPICLLTVMRYPNEGFATLNQPLTLEPIGIALPANDPQLVNLVQNYMTALEGTGIMQGLRQNWLESGAWVAALP